MTDLAERRRELEAEGAAVAEEEAGEIRAAVAGEGLGADAAARAGGDHPPVGVPPLTLSRLYVS